MAFSDVEEYYLDKSGASPVWRSYLDNHVVVGSTPPPARVFGDPGAGNLYLGQTNLDGSAGSNAGPNNHPTHYPRETFYGHRVGVNRDYFNEGSYNACRDAIAADLAVGRVPWKSIAMTTSWASFATGTNNTPFSNFCAQVDAIGKGPVMVTLQHEPNPSTATGFTAADYLAMYRRAKTFTDLYPQILLTPVLTAGNFEITGTEKLQFSDWVAADACDIFGFDSYNHVSYNPANGKKDLSIQQMFGQQVAQCHAMDPVKPWAVGEWGVRTGANGVNDNPEAFHAGTVATYMQAAFDYARLNGCYALSWFDSGINVNDSGSPWFFDDTTDGTDGTERMNKYIALLNSNAHSVYLPPGGLAKP